MPIKDQLSARIPDYTREVRQVLVQVRNAWNRMTGAPPRVTADDGLLELDWTLARAYRLTLSSDITTVDFIDPPSEFGDRGFYHLIVDQVGGFALSGFPAKVIWVGAAGYTVTATAGRTDLITFYWDGERYIADARQNAA